MSIKDNPDYQALKQAIEQQTESSKKELYELLESVSPEKTLTVKDVAEIIGVSEVSVRRWIKTGELKAAYFRGYRINPIDLTTFMRNRIKEVADSK